MKTLLAGCLFILVLQQSSYAMDDKFNVSNLTKEERAALREADPEQVDAWESCVDEIEDDGGNASSCINDTLGDIYN